jgi:AcrR family transcriptional regulator
MSRLLPPVAPAVAPRRRSRERVRAGGRSEDVRRRVSEACLALLGEGKADFGPVEVARRSGVSRATIHRWWPTKSDLLAEALALHTRSLVVPDTGTWEGDIRAFAHDLARFFADPVEVSQNALMASGGHADYTAAVLVAYESIFADWRSMIERAQARGEVRPDLDVDATILTLVAPLVVVPLLFRMELTPANVDALVDLLLRATTPS